VDFEGDVNIGWRVTLKRRKAVRPINPRVWMKSTIMLGVS
jgi:hypothetical protein